MFAAPANASTDLLNSWKEIAAYLNRGIRTVQRWEQDLGLPTRRPRGKRRTAVIAIRSEIDEWLKSASPKNPQPAAKGVNGGNELLPAFDERVPHAFKELILTSRTLCATVAQSRLEHRAAMVELAAHLEKSRKIRTESLILQPQ